MASLKSNQSSFTAGVLDPIVAGRHDSEIYYQGMEVGDNIIPLVQGGVTRRPGTIKIKTLPRRTTPSGPNLVPQPYNWNNTNWAPIVSGDYIAFTDTEGIDPDGNLIGGGSVADRVELDGYGASPGTLHGIQQSFTNPGSGKFTFSFFLLKETSGSMNINVYMGRSECFPNQLNPVDCPGFASASLSLDTDDDSWHNIILTYDKPSDGEDLDIWITYTLPELNTTNRSMLFWGGFLLPGDTAPKPIYHHNSSAFGVTMPNTAVPSTLRPEMVDFDDTTLVPTTVALGATANYVVVHIDLYRHFDIAHIDVRKLELVTGTNPATPSISNDFKVQTSHDDTTWNDVGDPLPTVDTTARDYRVSGDPVINSRMRDVRYIRLVRSTDNDSTNLVDWEVQLAGLNIYMADAYTADRVNDRPLPANDTFDSGWTLENITVTADSTNDPAGDAIGDTLTLPASGTGSYNIKRDVYVQLGKTYRFQFTAKVGTGSLEGIRLLASFTNPQSVFFDFDDTRVGSQNTANGRIFTQNDGYFLCEMIFTATEQGTVSIQMDILADGETLTFNSSSETMIAARAEIEEYHPSQPSNAKLMEFSFNPEQNYIIAASEQTLTIVRADGAQDIVEKSDGSLGVDPNSAVLSAPYTHDQIPELNWVQSADTMIIFHPDVVPKRLTRLSDTEWTLDDWPFTNIPNNDLGDGNGNTDIWADNGRGWPRCGVFYQNRLWMGGSFLAPNFLAGSGVGNFFDFNGGSAAADPINIFLDSDQVNEIRHLLEADQLAVLTSGDERITNNAANEPLTPENVEIPRQSKIGISEFVRPVTIGGEVFFISRPLDPSLQDSTDTRDIVQTVWQFLFDFGEGKFRPSDQALLSSHLLTGPTDMDAQAQKNSYVYVANSDGTIAVMLTSRQQELVAWSRWLSRAGNFKSIAVVQNGQVWTILEAVNGFGEYSNELCLFSKNTKLDLQQCFSFPDNVVEEVFEAPEASEENRVKIWDSGDLSAVADSTAEGIFTGDYDHYEVIGNLIPATNAVNLRLLLGAGAVIDTGANYARRSFRVANSHDINNPGGGQTELILSHDAVVSNVASDGGIGFKINIYNPFSGSVDTLVEGSTVYGVGTGVGNFYICGNHDGNTSDTSIRLLFGAGNIASGRWRIYGIPN